MSHLARATLHKPCIPYKRKYKPSEMETVQLRQSWRDGATTKRNCPIFSGAEGVEGLLHVRERFDQVSHHLEFTTGTELFDNWEQCLSDTAENRWNNLVQGIAEADRDAARFDTEYDNFVERYATARGRDYMREYLMSAKCNKPHDIECAEHAERLATMIRYTNKLAGTIPAIDEAQEKEIVFRSFPVSWQDNYNLTMQDYPNHGVQDIVTFMERQKSRTDRVEVERSSRGGRAGRTQGRYGRQDRRQNNQYRPYPNSSGDYHNDSYRPNTYNNRFRGNPSFRGGRGFGGRGFSGGRGNGPGRSYGRSSNYSNYQNQNHGRAPYNMNHNTPRGRDGREPSGRAPQNFYANNPGRGRGRAPRGRAPPRQQRNEWDHYHFEDENYGNQNFEQYDNSEYYAESFEHYHYDAEQYDESGNYPDYDQANYYDDSTDQWW